MLVFSMAACAGPQTVAEPAPAPQEQPAPVQVAPAPKAPQAPVALEEYFKIQRVGGASFSSDEKLVAFVSDQGGRLDIWVKPLAGGEARQLTQVQGFVHSFAFSPKQDKLVYEADVGGTELAHLYLTDSTGKEHKDLCADFPPTARTMFAGWAPDGKTFLYLSSKRDPALLDLVEYNLAKGKSTTLWEASGKLSLAAASRDHKRFVLTETLSDVDNNLYLLDRGKKKPELLTPHKGDVLTTPTAFSKDARTLYLASDEGSEYTAILAMDLKTKKTKPVLKADWDVEDAGFSQDWKYFYTVTNEDGTPRVVIRDAKTNKPIALPDLGGPGALVPLGFSPKDRYMAATLVTDQAPVDIYLVDLKQNTASKLTKVLPESLAEVSMVSAESVRIPSFDQREVPAFLYKPAGDGPHPAVIDVHGGPTYQSRRRFDPFRQYLVSKGYVVLVPNVRGSTGYGKTYTKLDNLDLGGGPLQDVVACKNWLAANASVAVDQVVVMGGSYGGYVALAAATFTPKEFAAHVDYFGPSDLKTLVESFPPYWAAFASFIYAKFGDPKNPEHAQYQRDRSPIHFVDKIERPLLVVQGANDARVRQDQSDRIVEALKARQVVVEYMILPDEGHGFSKDESRLKTYQLTDRFLDRHLFGDTSVVVQPQ
jgi:dipeptidyl aminopeptidase/acylaminoacyl peptidase